MTQNIRLRSRGDIHVGAVILALLYRTVCYFFQGIVRHRIRQLISRGRGCHFDSRRARVVAMVQKRAHVKGEAGLRNIRSSCAHSVSEWARDGQIVRLTLLIDTSAAKFASRQPQLTLLESCCRCGAMSTSWRGISDRHWRPFWCRYLYGELFNTRCGYDNYPESRA